MAGTWYHTWYKYDGGNTQMTMAECFYRDLCRSKRYSRRQGTGTTGTTGTWYLVPGTSRVPGTSSMPVLDGELRVLDNALRTSGTQVPGTSSSTTA